RRLTWRHFALGRPRRIDRRDLRRRRDLPRFESTHHYAAEPELARSDVRRDARGGGDFERTHRCEEAGMSTRAASEELERGGVGRGFGQLVAKLPILQILAIGVVFGYGVATLPGLGTWVSIKTILVLGSLVGLAATGQTLLILMGGFDLSIPSFIVASALM